MGIFQIFRQFIVTLFLWAVGFSLPLHAESGDLLARLQAAETAEDARRIDRDLQVQWARSGSAAMDLLLRRGRTALDDGDTAAALEHFRALTDHAPEFAEGWHGLARAFFAADMYGPALDALEHVLALNPDQYDAIFGLGMMLGEMGDMRRAEAAFRHTLRLHPHHEEAKEALKRLEHQGIGRSL